MKINDHDIALIAGLGNPGDSYASTYHNVGQLFIDHYLQHHGIAALTFKQKDSFSFFRIDPCIFIKPNTFMNDSGRALMRALTMFKLKPAQLLVVHDDSDIAIGSYKLSFGRGSAGHRGITSIINTIGTADFWRLRIGIRQNADAHGPYAERRRKKLRKPAADIVLKPISKRHLTILHALFDELSSQYTL